MSSRAKRKPAKQFTVEEANAALPLVRAITQDLAQLSREVIERRQRLDHLTYGRELSTGDPYGDELVQIEEELEKDSQKLQEYVDELRELGVEPKSASEGIVDFPAMMDDRQVYLCWKLGEPEVLYWHETNTGFAARQPLTAGIVSGDDSGEAEGAMDS